MATHSNLPLSVVKIGGNVVDKPEALTSFLHDFHQLKGRKLLVHGGGVLASKMAERLGITTKMVNGRRVTDAETLQMVTMVYAGWINKSIVAQLQQIGCNAIGLSGVDGNAIPSARRNPEPIDFGFVGDPITRKMDGELITTLLEKEIVPVFCAITHDGNGSLLNTNADTVASSLAISLSKQYRTTLYYCFEKEGVLCDVNDSESLIPLINRETFAQLREQGVIADGMIPKLDNSFSAIQEGVSEVMILHARNLLQKRGTMLIG
jgi:acetylglutamate kinase